MSRDGTDRVIDAANHTLSIGASSEGLFTAMKTSLSMFGADLAASLGEDERIALLVPAQVEVNGSKINPGVLLIGEHQAILTWMEGTLRPKTHVRRTGYPEITNVAVIQRKPGRLAAANQTVTYDVGTEHFEVILYSHYMQPAITPMIEGILGGWATPTWSDDELAPGSDG
jgi:hypothetical protein